MKIKKFTVTILAVALLLSPAFSFADTATTTPVSSQIQALLDQIKTLQTQLAALKSAQDQVTQAQANISQTFTLMRSLKQGLSGDDVKALQAVLAADPTIYPQGLITGYYGPMTADAVKKFQNKYGIDAIGSVGPKTLEKVNEEMNKLSISQENEGTSGDGTKTLCVRVAPGHLVAPGWLKKNNETESIVPECQNLPNGIQNKLENQGGDNNNSNNQSEDNKNNSNNQGEDNKNNSNSENESENGNQTNNTTNPAPIISNISVSYNTLGSAASSTITWNTNEPATSKVWYGTTTPIVLQLPTLSVYSNSFDMSHIMQLSGLSTSTTYYYVIESSDAYGNISTTTQNSFTIPTN